MLYREQKKIRATTCLLLLLIVSVVSGSIGYATGKGQAQRISDSARLEVARHTIETIHRMAEWQMKSIVLCGHCHLERQ